MREELNVSMFGRWIGTLAIEGELRSPEEWSFTYDAEAVARGGAALSVSLPLRVEPFGGAVVRNWFCNLLPEGIVREAIVARLRLPARDDFALLAAIGGECAGAVSVVRPDAIVPDEEDGRDLDALVQRLGVAMGDGAWATLAAPRRLSLAGAQDKLAVVRTESGHLRLPARGELSTHILKPDSLRFPGLRDLEALGLRLARAVGLKAVDAELIDVGGHRALLIERYDRSRNGQAIARLHQEDFCQALGYPPEMKYQSQGGPCLARCAGLLRDLQLGPAALQGFLDWIVYGVAVGNADAHAKNLALTCTPEGRRSIAPFYDLVPTIALPESLVERTPALSIGDARRVDAVGIDDWRSFSKQAGFGARFTLDRVASLAGAVREKLAEVADRLVAEGADSRTLLEGAMPAIDAQARRLQNPKQ
ncbi:MAG: type II toxin-antitoxin system HipA family toxin [Proteobacteria bacterium]|nr:type II toxin-antitoxin system HipA family toxin [Pseudomonadota bacterium]